jgi:cytochrome c oxidase cbb3-type subunit I/II
VTTARSDSAGRPATLNVVYCDRVARQFALASLVWGGLAMGVGLLIALQLAFWPANLPPYLSFGRIRPIHTSAAVFAFAGNLVFAGVYHASQRLLAVRMQSTRLAALHFWSWQLAIAAAVVTAPLGLSQGKELSEPEWPVDLLLALSWLAFALNFAAMVRRRNRRRLHPALWFIVATIIALGAGHVAASLAVPVGLFKSYSLLGGVGDALVHAWYGHGAITFFLTAPFLGLMYYFLPAAAERPIYSHRLTIIHFWSLVVVFGWAAPQHLLNTALPDWAQSAGTAFALASWVPLSAGVVNGLATLRGAWSRLRTDPVLQFFTAALLFHALAALQGAVLGFKSVSGLAHYTDWPIGQTHAIALGWSGLMAAGILYWMVPRLYGTRLHSTAAAGAHFYMAVVGILVYLSAMWIAGATQGTMWRAELSTGGLAYGFVETVVALRIPTWSRLAGGALYMAGFVLMAWNLARTVRAGRATDESEEVELDRDADDGVRGLVFAQPVLVAAAIIALCVAAGFANPLAALGLFLLALFLALGGLAGAAILRAKPTWHDRIERRGLALTSLVAAALLIGPAVEIAPLLARAPEPVPGESAPYSPLQLEGRDLYIAEGCHACHSQMIRPFLWEVARYGEVSSATESLYDHPFQWGSRRIGPDLARVGGRYPNLWHYQHLVDPRALTPGSTMPPYPHLAEARVDLAATPAKLRALRSVGVPYADEIIERAAASALAEGRAIALDLRKNGGIEAAPDSAIVALIAYLQRLGQPP